jgi:hypothetical protein
MRLFGGLQQIVNEMWQAGDWAHEGQGLFYRVK